MSNGFLNFGPPTQASKLTLWLRTFRLGRLFVEYRLGWQLGCSHRESWRVAKLMSWEIKDETRDRNANR
jgi:hypothetical protein